jgi:uncharacterized membrane protein
LFLLFSTTQIFAEEFSVGKVESVISEKNYYDENLGEDLVDQTVEVESLSTSESQVLNYNGTQKKMTTKILKEGQKVVLRFDEASDSHYVADHFRLLPLALLFLLFVSLILYFTGKRGGASLLGLSFSLLVLAFFLAPKILAGADPLVYSFFTANFIVSVSLFLAHGFNKKTAIALLSIIASIFVSLLSALLFTKLAFLSGMGTEEAFYLQLNSETFINMQGVLLGGIIIGTLGILDDVTVTQVASVYELKKANKNYGFKKLYSSAMNIGKEHILSMTNTLVLAYAGAFFPVFLMFSLKGAAPLWVTLNNEFLAEEIVRTLIGSITLTLAVPISSFLAAYYFQNKEVS